MATIVLCGSTRFRDQFTEANHELSKLGHVVLTLADPSPMGGELDPVDKIMFDLVYFEKIRMADIVFVIDDGGAIGARDGKPYIGFSTAREILWADMNEKPIISRQHAAGWGQVDDLLDERYSIRDSSVYRGIVAWARETLRTTAGVSQVKKLVGETAIHALEEMPNPIDFTRQHRVMHAVLSILACQAGTVATMCEIALAEVSLDAMDNGDVETALTDVAVIPDELTFLANGSPRPASTEPMKKIELRRLVGTIIMARACSDMLAQMPKIKRREVVDKIDMMIETLYRSFELSREEVDAALHGHSSKMDVGNELMRPIRD